MEKLFIRELPAGTEIKGKQNIAFCSIYAPIYHPFTHYSDEIPDEIRDKIINLNVPHILMSKRWDGQLGFCGGRGIEGESIIETVLRESKQEYNVILEPSRIEGMLSWERDKNVIHSYSYEVTEDEFMNIYQNSVFAQHIKSENEGCFKLGCGIYSNGKGYLESLKHQFSGTAKNQLIYLVNSKKLLVYIDWDRK